MSNLEIIICFHRIYNPIFYIMYIINFPQEIIGQPPFFANWILENFESKNLNVSNFNDKNNIILLYCLSMW